MSKMRNGKKKLLMILLAIILIIVLVVVVIVMKQKEPETPPVEENLVYDLPSTTYSDIEVTNVQMEYLKDNNETMISMQFNNTTDELVENEALEVIWINADEEVIGRIPTHINKLEPGGQYSISVIEKGDLTATAQIKLEKK